jgi:serine/threonine-protein kinase
MEKRGVESVMRIRSNRLVSIQDYGKTVNSEDCVLMEYLPENLETVLEIGALDEATACRYFVEILKGLKVLEGHRILHRDIKPGNLFILEDIIKIGDFGTAKYTSGETFSRSSAVGTLHYMAPECFRNQHGFPADRWAAAVIFYRLLTGYFVFDGENPAGVIGGIMNDEPDTDLVPPRYRPFFKKCFEKEVRRRHRSIDNMLKEAETFLDDRQHGKLLSDPVCEEAPPEQDRRKYYLRHHPIRVPNEKLYKILGLDNRLRPLRYVENDFEDNRNGTVTDYATGLMWQKSGSSVYMEYPNVQDYLRELNRGRFAGYSDWRLPTVEELISLAEPEKFSNDLYLDPIFDKKQCWCWSSDKRSLTSAWHVQFDCGYFHYYEDRCYVRAVRFVQPRRCL